MKRFFQLLWIFGLVSVMAAQEAPKHLQKIYKVVFLIYEVEDGKKINERTYTLPVTSVDGNPRDTTMSVGSRVPIATAGTTGDKIQWQYIDIGLNIDCSVTEQEDKFIVRGGIVLSSLAIPEQGIDPRSGGNPVVRQVKENFTTLVPPGKPTLVTTMDDINSKKRTQVEITATRIQ
ncbi:MAG TPA: hypothetical protein VKD65_11310 [Candidatus Angelobacter sp.]|nr:hypothetical protein [Candidatus Angelobacter sp.]